MIGLYKAIINNYKVTIRLYKVTIRLYKVIIRLYKLIIRPLLRPPIKSVRTLTRVFYKTIIRVL